MNLLVASAVITPEARRVLQESVPSSVRVDHIDVPWNGGQAVELAPGWASKLAQAEVLVGFAQQFESLHLTAPDLAWVHHCGAGYEAVDLEALSTHGIGLVSAAGAGARGISEFVILAMLSLARRAQEIHQAQAEHLWKPLPSFELGGRRLTVVGAGEIGSRVCSLAAAFGLEVSCVRRNLHSPPPAGASRVVGRDRLHELLPQSDILVLAAPATAETDGLLNAESLKLLPHGALIINVARASLIDHDALLDRLAAGHLEGVWLDVVPDEPLGPDSRLWSTPGLIVSSHTAVAIRSYPTSLARQMGQAVTDWLAGRPVAHTVLPMPPPVTPSGK